MERLIIKSEYNNKTKKVVTALQILLTLLGISSLFAAFWEWDQDCYFWVYTLGKKPLIIQYPGFWIAVVCLALFIGAVVIKKTSRNSYIAVSDCNVSGITVFGKTVNIPLAMVHSVEKSALSGITVVTSAEKLMFPAVKNQEDIYNVLNQLLINRGVVLNQPVIAVNVPVPQQTVVTVYTPVPAQHATQSVCCSRCGSPVMVGDKLCRNCGSVLNWG